MKNKGIAVVFLLLVLALPLYGCTQNPYWSHEPEDSTPTPPIQTSFAEVDPALSDLCSTVIDNGFEIGIAFIGFAESDVTEDELYSVLKNSEYAQKYPFLCDARIADAGGNELYAVVTAKKDCRVSVYRTEVTESGEYGVRTDAALYDGKGMGCFLLRCNESDIYSNAAVFWENGDERVWIYPRLSGNDGRIEAEDCYDFSIYSQNNADEYKNVRIARELLTEARQVRERMVQGMALLYTGEHLTVDGRDCMIFALGTNRGDLFVSEYLYGVCDNLIYVYDAVADTWTALGAD